MEQSGLSSDKALSWKLQVNKHVIQSIRTGQLPIGASMLLWMIDISGMSIEELRRILGDKRSKARLNCTLKAA
jgi:hypothetical protein